MIENCNYCPISDFAKHVLNLYSSISLSLPLSLSLSLSLSLFQMIATVSIFFNILSIFVFAAKTEVRHKIPVIFNSTFVGPHGKIGWHMIFFEPMVHPNFFYIECFCNTWFTFEFIIRLIVCPSLLELVKKPYNFIEFVATLSFYTDHIAVYFLTHHSNKHNNPAEELLNILSLFRVLRLLKLTQYSAGLSILMHTFYASGKELILLLFLILLGIVIFASLMFYAEHVDFSPQNQFPSIGDGLWWAIVTMTTVG